jgi:YgiT-type zinc finger domain-containing protein
MVGRLQSTELDMNCVICKHGTTAPGKTTVTLERGGTVVVIKDVPAEICGDCGEYYLDEPTNAGVLQMGEEAVLHHAEVEVRKYAA